MTRGQKYLFNAGGQRMRGALHGMFDKGEIILPLTAGALTGAINRPIINPGDIG